MSGIGSFRPVHPGDEVSDEQVFHVLSGVRNRTLPKSEWTHGAHFCAAIGMLSEQGLESAEAAIPETIRSFNRSIGVRNTDIEGYHHTLTLFYLRILQALVIDANPDDARVGELVTMALDSPIARDRKYPLAYYTRELINSTRARKTWVEPDVKPLP